MSPDHDSDNFLNELKDLEPQSLLYRVFECPIVDWDMENELFQSLSDQGIGPKLYYQCAEYRIEGFFLSRPLTIFEMRNDIFLSAYAEKICDFNHNQDAMAKVERYIPKTQLYARQWMGPWMQKVKERLPVIIEKQKDHPEVLKIIGNF